MEMRPVYTATDADLKKTVGHTRYETTAEGSLGVMNQRHSDDSSHLSFVP
jgi:hypothetical protein